MLTRKEFLQLIAGAAAAPFAGALWPGLMRAAAQAPQPASPDLLARIGRLIQEYDAQGIHRTGTQVDTQSASWLLKRAIEAGADVELSMFPLSRVDVQTALLEADGRQVPGLPLFDGTFTDARGLDGRLVLPAASGDFALLTADAAGITSEGRGLSELRKSGRFKAIVVVTQGAHAGLSPMNAADFAAPYGCPVLQVGSEGGPWLQERAAASRTARFVAHATRTNTEAFNVVGAVAGSRPELPPVVVMTPRSGWWQCASERGGGIACWTETIRAVRAARAPRTVRFIASSGHELGHFGLDAWLESQPGLIKRAAAWIHLGANIGAAGGRPRLQASSDEIEAMAAAAFERAGTPVQQRVPRGNVPGGEARNIHVGGGRYVSLLGSSPVFHSEADRWPSAVDVAAVGRYATAIGELAVGLARQ
jgi:hypothetical protein